MLQTLKRLMGLGNPHLPEQLDRHKDVRKRLDTQKPLEETEFVVFDTELTGLSFKRDSIVSIGALKMRGGMILPGEDFYRLVRPETELKGASVCIHEITPTELIFAQSAPEVLVEFIDYIGDAVLVGHFVSIDTTFTSKALRKHFGLKLHSHAIDTVILHDWFVEHNAILSRHWGGMCREKNLFIMAKHYGVDPGMAHNALSDAFVTAQLFQRLMAFLPESGIKTIGGLLKVAKL